MAETIKHASALDAATRDWLIAELRFPVMATIRSDGMPSQSVVWFDLDPDGTDTILMNTRAGRLKHRHLRRDPRVSLCFEDGNDYVTVRGSRRARRRPGPRPVGDPGASRGATTTIRGRSRASAA